jgi:ribosome-binding factor A
MSGHRIDRITEDVHRELTDIFRSLKDPRISGMLSIVRVDVSSDLSVAKIYVSSVEGAENTKEAIKGLVIASGFIRHELSARLDIRHTPQLKFIADDSMEYSANISKILNK